MSKPNSVLGLHPSARGFGWALFEGRPLLIDCGAVEIHGENKSAQALKQIEGLLTKWRPSVIALEDPEHPTSFRRARVRRLYRAIAERARRRGIEVCKMARREVAHTLLNDRSAKRLGVAVAVAERVEVLRPKLPRKQKIWVGEDHNMGLFCAAACALSYYLSNSTRCGA